MAGQLWRYAELVDHWDELVLRAWADGDLYQEAPGRGDAEPAELIAGYTGGVGSLPEGTVLFSGTIATRGGLRPGGGSGSSRDRVMGRALRHEYRVRSLPIAG